MKVFYSATAEQQLINHLTRGIGSFGEQVAERTYLRVVTYVEDVLAVFPRSARYHAQIDVFEAWVPRTPLIVYYRVKPDTDTLAVVGIFHAAQDRSDLGPSDFGD